MKRPITISDILNSKCGNLNQHLREKTSINEVGKYNKLQSKGGKEKQWLLLNLTEWCLSKGYELKTEYRFHPARKFRFDYAITEIKTAIEYEGIMSKKSRHTTVSGYTTDSDKYNIATAMGWKVFRVTAVNYKTVIENLNSIQ